MSDSNRPIDLRDSWKKAGVAIKIPPLQPRSAKNTKRKKKGKEDGTSTVALDAKEAVKLRREAIAEGKKAVGSSGPLDPHKIHLSPAYQSGVTAGVGTSPSPLPEPASKRARVSSDTSDPDADLKRQKDVVEGRLREKGLIPSIADLEACQRVVAGGLALFQELAGALAGQLSQRLEDNRALKEELEALWGVQEKLQAANTKVAEQAKQLERLPVAEHERDQTRKFASEAKEEASKLRTRVEELTKAVEAADVRFCSATAEGFQRALDLTAVLAPEVNFQFIDGDHDVREGKIWLGEHMVFDPAEHLSEADDAGESPENVGESE